MVRRTDKTHEREAIKLMVRRAGKTDGKEIHRADGR
jgi:hypothetical protein